MLAKASPLKPIDFIVCRSSYFDSFDVVCLSHSIGRSSYCIHNSDHVKCTIFWSKELKIHLNVQLIQNHIKKGVN
jgi:hypothetical protein